MAQYENLEGWEKLSLGMQLDKWAIRYGNRIAVTDSEEEITYSELNQKAIGTGQYFMEKGIQKGDKVLVQLPNRISFVVVLFALAKIGAVPIMMLPAHRETELEGIIALAKPSAYIVAERYLGFYYVEMAMAMQKKFPCIQNVFVDGTQRGAWYEAETERQGVFPEVDSYSTAVLLLSGGTTGVPKLIPRTHTDYMYNARMSAKRCQLDESSVYLAALPVAHNFPLCCPGLLGTFDIGGKVVLAPTTSPDDILTAITEEKVTITALVPAMVTVCMEMLEYDEDYDISSLKILQVGGAMLEDSLADKIIEEWPCTLMQVFGTAEGLLSFTSPDDDVTVIARCQGTPVSPADEVKIVDENDEEVPTGVFGELLSRGPYTIDGYYMAEETNRTSFTEDGFYRTGDKAMWTGKGHLRMGGRIKEQINRAGEKIMPAEIEAYLCKHSDIKEAAVVGVPDETLGNRICAFILTEKGNALDVQAVHQFLKEIGVASYKLPDQVEIMDCFGRWYRTGDNGCFWNDGTIEYRGRRDFQVKVKGHRIELGEIEAILNKIAGVKKSIVCAVEHNNRKNMLVAVVVKESPNINEEFLMQNLKSKLPVYMLPTKIIFEDKLPVGKNAKQDRKEVVRWIKAHEDRNIENEEKLTPCETRIQKK